jgi:hypothetical protein
MLVRNVIVWPLRMLIRPRCIVFLSVECAVWDLPLKQYQHVISIQPIFWFIIITSQSNEQQERGVYRYNQNDKGRKKIKRKIYEISYTQIFIIKNRDFFIYLKFTDNSWEKNIYITGKISTAQPHS